MNLTHSSLESHEFFYATFQGLNECYKDLLEAFIRGVFKTQLDVFLTKSFILDVWVGFECASV